MWFLEEGVITPDPTSGLPYRPGKTRKLGSNKIFGKIILNTTMVRPSQVLIMTETVVRTAGWGWTYVKGIKGPVDEPS